MTAAERARHELSARLEEVLGPEQAATLMEHLPPVRWDELARQEDLLALRKDVSGLRTDVDQLKTDVTDLRTATLLQGERLEHLSQVMTLRFDGLNDHITATVAQRMDSQTKLLVLSILGAFLTAVAISIGATAL